MKEFNKKQIEAIEYLKNDLNELSNKPRRLFSSLERFADAFVERETPEEKENYNDVVSEICEFQEIYYKNIRSYSILEDSGRVARSVRKELFKKADKEWKDEVNAYKQGVIDATKNMAIEFNNNLINELY